MLIVTNDKANDELIKRQKYYITKDVNERTNGEEHGGTRQNRKGTAICKLDKGGACKFRPGAQTTPLAHPAAAKLATKLDSYLEPPPLHVSTLTD